MPVLGVCGGMQLLNVVLGGTLYQDIAPRGAGRARRTSRSTIARQPQHPVEVKDGTLLAEARGARAS